MTSLERILTKTLMELLIIVDHDDAIHPDLAVISQPTVTALLHDTSPKDQRTAADMIYQYAEEETHPERRFTALNVSTCRFRTPVNELLRIVMIRRCLSRIQR